MCSIRYDPEVDHLVLTPGGVMNSSLSLFRLKDLVIPFHKRDPLSTYMVIPFHKHDPLSTYMVIPFHKHDPLSTYMVIPFHKRGPLSTYMVISFHKRDPLSTYMVIPFHKRGPLSTYMVIPFHKRDPLSTYMVIPFHKRFRSAFYGQCFLLRAFITVERHLVTVNDGNINIKFVMKVFSDEPNIFNIFENPFFSILATY